MEAQGAQPAWISGMRVLLQLATPVFFVLTSVRLLLTHAFIRFEYALPGFPADPFGFTRNERIQYADQALDYLLNDSGIEYLGDPEFADGTPLYNARELRHMSDVKRVTQAALQVWVGSGLLALALGIGLSRFAGVDELLRALVGGARLTAGVMALLIVGLAIGFSVIFVGFHRVFFEGDSWLFRHSDTLIRLFPERFWQVAFGTIAVETLSQSGLLYLIVNWLADRRA